MRFFMPSSEFYKTPKTSAVNPLPFNLSPPEMKRAFLKTPAKKTTSNRRRNHYFG